MALDTRFQTGGQTLPTLIKILDDDEIEIPPPEAKMTFGEFLDRVQGFMALHFHKLGLPPCDIGRGLVPPFLGVCPLESNEGDRRVSTMLRFRFDGQSLYLQLSANHYFVPLDPRMPLIEALREKPCQRVCTLIQATGISPAFINRADIEGAWTEFKNSAALFCHAGLSDPDRWLKKILGSSDSANLVSNRMASKTLDKATLIKTPQGWGLETQWSEPDQKAPETYIVPPAKVSVAPFLFVHGRLPCSMAEVHEMMVSAQRTRKVDRGLR